MSYMNFVSAPTNIVLPISCYNYSYNQLNIQTGGSGTESPTKVGEADKAACYCGEANDQGIDLASGGRPPGQYL